MSFCCHLKQKGGRCAEPAPIYRGENLASRPIAYHKASFPFGEKFSLSPSPTFPPAPARKARKDRHPSTTFFLSQWHSPIVHNFIPLWFLARFIRSYEVQHQKVKNPLNLLSTHPSGVDFIVSKGLWKLRLKILIKSGFLWYNFSVSKRSRLWTTTNNQSRRFFDAETLASTATTHAYLL